jgi:hypothetical protein
LKYFFGVFWIVVKPTLPRDSISWAWFIKTKGKDYQNFYWQNGYGAFSVRASGVDTVINYIANQKEHHSKKEFKNEYRAFLKEHDVEYDERYVWD